MLGSLLSIFCFRRTQGKRRTPLGSQWLFCALVLLAIVSVAPATLPAQGAFTPFQTYYLESPANSRTLGGSAVVVTTDVTGNSYMRSETTRHAYISLGSTGDSVSFTAAQEADSLVVRYSLPYTVGENHNTTYTLSVWVNGVQQPSLTTSLYYIHSDQGSTNSFAPATTTALADVRRWWEEAVLTLSSPIMPGDTVTLEKTSSDTATEYDLDTVDLEMRPPQIAPDSSWTDSGMSTSDPTGSSNSTALNAAIVTAEGTAAKTVWIAPGTYNIDGEIIVHAADSGVFIQGAGMWYTTLVNNITAPATGDDMILIAANNVTVRDLKLDSLINERRDPTSGTNNGTGIEAAQSTVTGMTVNNVWVNHTTAPVWYAGDNGTIINSRYRGGYAGGFHIQGSASDNFVNNNHTRGAGDAGMVVWSPASGSQAVGNTVSYNTVEGSYYGDGTDLAGGQNTVYDSNAILGGLMFTGLRYTTVAGANANNPVVNTQVTNNVFDHAGMVDPTISLAADAVLVNPADDTIDTTMTGNTFSNLEATGIDIYPSFAVTGSIAGNTIYQPATGSYFNVTNTNPGTTITTTPNTLPGPGGPSGSPSALSSLSASGGNAAVTLSWPASSGATSYHVKRSTTSGGPYAVVGSPTTTTYVDPSLTPGTTYYYVVSAVNKVSMIDGNGESANSSEVNATPTGQALTDLDIGAPGMTGSASYSGGAWTVQGGGADVRGTSDQFNYAYEASLGDTTLVARIVSVQNTNVAAKAGLMIRESTAADAAEVSLFVTYGSGVLMRIRSSTGANTSQSRLAGSISAPYWLKLVRFDNTFTGYASPDGVTWTEVAAVSVNMASNATQGLAVTATDNTQLNTSVIDNFTITP